MEYLASKLGIDYSSYSRIELGKTSLTVERLNEIADVLGVSAVELQLKPQESGDFYDVLKGGQNWLEKLKEAERLSVQAVQCREELSAAQKKIIELQARLLDVLEKK